MIDAKRIFSEGDIVRHFKGKYYICYGEVEHTETGEKYMVYRALYPPYKKYARPLSMFVSEVDKQKYPNIERTYRFEKCF